MKLEWWSGESRSEISIATLSEEGARPSSPLMEPELIISLLLQAPTATETPKHKSGGIKLHALILFYPISMVLKHAGEFKDDSNYTLKDFLAFGKKIEFLTDGAQFFSQLYLCDLHMLVM